VVKTTGWGLREDLQLKVAWLKRLVDECPPVPASVSGEIQHILKTAPQLLDDMDKTIQSGDAAALAQVAALIEHAEAMLRWALDSVKGTATVEAIEAGREADPALPAEQRLMNRLTRFMASQVDRAHFATLAQAFAGADAVQGDRIYMDPTHEAEAFSHWLMHDITLPGTSRRLIECFAEEHGEDLLEDERPLLTAHLHDRPSVYQVVTLSHDRKTRRPKDTYRVRDLLTPAEELRITDRASARQLHTGSIFMGRAIPIDRPSAHYQLLGTLTVLPAAVWADLSHIIEEWNAQYREHYPQATVVAFYRAHYARLVRTLEKLADKGPALH